MRDAKTRKGHHPRDPHQAAVDDPAADLQQELPGELGDLGADEEAEAARPGPPVAPATSGDGGAPKPDNLDDDGDDGPEKNTRRRKKITSTASGPDRSADWSRFNVQASLRALRSGAEHVQKRILRKLHLRWWHASEGTMRKVLAAAGVPEQTLKLIRDITANCRQCRIWTTPSPDTKASHDVTTKVNETVEFDLMFYKQHIICHIVDRASRFHGGIEINSKSKEDVLDGIHKCWINFMLAPQQLYADGESAIFAEEIHQELKALGTEVVTRAPQQHCRYIERRGALLRHSMHVIESQAEREGRNISFAVLLSEAIQAGNSLININGSTPYQCVFGRQPALLPPLDLDPELADPDTESGRMWVRRAALQAMIEGTAIQHIARTLKSKTSQQTSYSKGDLVDYFRPPANKDTSGWHGPVRVVKHVPELGQVIVQINGVDRPCRLQDVRLSILVLSVLHSILENDTVAQRDVVKFISSLPEGSTLTCGFTGAGKHITLTSATKKHNDIVKTLIKIAETSLGIRQLVAIRLVNNASNLKAFPIASHSTVVYWHRREPQNTMTFESTADAVSLSKLAGKQWLGVQGVQFLHGSSNDLVLDMETVDPAPPDSGAEQPPPGAETDAADEAGTQIGNLPTIEEGSDEGSMSGQPLPLIELVEEPSMEYEELLDPAFADYLTDGIGAIDSGGSSIEEHDDDGNDCLHIYINPEIAAYFVDVPPAPDEYVYLEFLIKNKAKSAAKAIVTKRKDDVLTADEVKQHPEEIKKAIKNEIDLWVKYKIMTRAPRAGAQNIVTSRFVYKWKIINGIRTIRARMVLHGFKDVVKDDTDTYAGTASRVSQRLLVSEAALHPDWAFATADISKAFLQGMTYKEISQATGKNEKIMHFTLPKGCDIILGSYPEFKGYSEHWEVLRCRRPGTGTVDAPRSFSLMLKSILTVIGWTATAVDAELLIYFTDKLYGIMSVHVDDIKLACEDWLFQETTRQLEQRFGKLEIKKDDFVNVGIRHRRQRNGDIILDQCAYIESLGQIKSKNITKSSGATLCDPADHQQFRSLLGALAYCVMTQLWAIVYIVSLQRVASAPRHEHCVRLNKLVRMVKAQPAETIFRNMACQKKLIVHSDASFRRESDKGYAMRGAAYLRCGTLNGQTIVHFLLAVGKSQNLVTRSTYAAELLAAAASADHATPLLISLQEFAHGPVAAHDLKELRQNGGYLFELELCIDAKSVYDSLISLMVKTPGEASLLGHLLWLREFLSKRIVTSLIWTDTRDMIADGLTKGAIPRGLLLAAMEGIYKLQHECLKHLPGNAVEENTPNDNNECGDAVWPI